MPHKQLAIELWIDIIETIYYDTRDAVDYATLSSCSRVCSSWTEPSQKLLFRSIDLTQDDSRRYRRLMAQIKSFPTRGKNLSSYIRVLEVSVGVISSPQWGIPQHEFAQLILFCPHLYHLTLWSALHKFDKDTMTALQVAAVGNGVQLRALNLAKCGRQSPILYQLISVWPGIQFLRIGGRICASPPSQPSSIKLHGLVLSFGEQLPSNMLDWLLSNSERSLHVLELWDEPGPRMRNLLSKHGGHLRVLRMPCFNKVAVEIMDLCPKLAELALVIFHSTALMRLRHLPSSIEHFAVRNMAKRSLHRPVINVINTLPNLRVVTCDQDSQQQADFSALQKACEIRSLDLRTDHKYLWLGDVPVIPRYFPRFRFVSDSPLMPDQRLCSESTRLTGWA